MTDDNNNNVTGLPDQSNKGGGKPKTPAQIIAEIKNQRANVKASEFKKKLELLLIEKEGHEKNIKLAQEKIDRAIEEYVADNQ